MNDTPHSSNSYFVGRCFMLHWKKHFIFDRCCISFLYCCHLCGAHLRHCYTLAEQSVRAVIWCLFWVAWWNIALSTAKDKHWGFRCTSPSLLKPAADLSSRSSTPTRTYDESLCFASASQFIMSVLLKVSLCIVPWCLLTMCTWFVVWSAVNRKVWRSLFLCVCDAVGQDQLWKGGCAYCAVSGLIKCVTVFSQQWWPVARAKLAVAYAVCFVFFSLWSLFCIPVWKCCVGILFMSVWSDVCHCLLLCERQQCDVDAFTASHHVSQSPDSPRIKNQIRFAFACGYPGCIFSRRGQQVSQLTVAMQQ